MNQPTDHRNRPITVRIAIVLGVIAIIAALGYIAYLVEIEQSNSARWHRCDSPTEEQYLDALTDYTDAIAAQLYTIADMHDDMTSDSRVLRDRQWLEAALDTITTTRTLARRMGGLRPPHRLEPVHEQIRLAVGGILYSTGKLAGGIADVDTEALALSDTHMTLAVLYTEEARALRIEICGV